MEVDETSQVVAAIERANEARVTVRK